MAGQESNSDQQMRKELSKQFYDVVERVVVTEKSTRMMEFENKLVFEVVEGASKPIIKMLVEEEFGKKVKKVNTLNNIKGNKLAVVTFVEDEAASSLASDMGLV